MELFTAISLFNRRKFDECTALCTTLLKERPLDQTVWILKMRSLTLQLYVDDIEGEEEGIAEGLLDNYTIPMTGNGVGPKTQSGRPVTGTLRPITQSATAQSMDQTSRMWNVDGVK